MPDPAAKPKKKQHHVQIWTPDIGWPGDLMARTGKAIAERGHFVTWRDINLYDFSDRSDLRGVTAVIVIGMNNMIFDIARYGFENGFDTYIVTDGFLGCREKQDRLRERQWAIGKNGFHAYAQNPDFMVPGDRWQKLCENYGVEMKPWKADSAGEYVLVAYQYAAVPMHNIDKRPYFQEALEELAAVSDRPIHFRKHPLDRGRTALPSGVIESTEPSFEEALRRAHCVVTYDSNAALEAVLAGVPAFTLGKSITDPVAMKIMEPADWKKANNPDRPDRQQWAHWIAYLQYSGIEMSNGEAWRIMLDGEYPRVDVAATEANALPAEIAQENQENSEKKATGESSNRGLARGTKARATPNTQPKRRARKQSKRGAATT